MRALAGLILLTLISCAPEREPGREAAAAPVAAIDIPAAARARSAQSTPLMEKPEDPDELKRLEAMGYTIHDDHLHAPGVTACPKMGDGPVM